MQSRDIAQADGKKLSMSEVDGSWQSGSYNPYGFDNALGMMSKISSNVTRLQSNGLHLLAGGRGPLQHADGLECESGR